MYSATASTPQLWRRQASSKNNAVRSSRLPLHSVVGAGVTVGTGVTEGAEVVGVKLGAALELGEGVGKGEMPSTGATKWHATSAVRAIP